MTVTVVCHTHDCPTEGVEKTVGRQHLGQNVYVGGTFLCGHCGRTMTEVDPDPTSPTP